MTNTGHKRMCVQLHEIMMAMWEEKGNIQSQPDGEFILKWINNHSAEFSKKWDASKCKNCLLAEGCGFKLLKACELFLPEKEM